MPALPEQVARVLLAMALDDALKRNEQGVCSDFDLYAQRLA